MKVENLIVQYIAALGMVSGIIFSIVAWSISRDVGGELSKAFRIFIASVVVFTLAFLVSVAAGLDYLDTSLAMIIHMSLMVSSMGLIVLFITRLTKILR